MRTRRHRHATTEGVQGRLFALRPDGAPALRCPHGVDHPSWCPVCHTHWEARMRHPSWPRRHADA